MDCISYYTLGTTDYSTLTGDTYAVMDIECPTTGIGLLCEHAAVYVPGAENAAVYLPGAEIGNVIASGAERGTVT
jgi:hypothetical protein